VVYDISQFRFGEDNITKIRLSAVSSANEFIQETRCAKLNIGYGTIVMRMNNVIRRAIKDTINISLKSVGAEQYIQVLVKYSE